MPSRVGQKIKMTSVDELLGVPSTEGTVDLDVMMIFPFKNHPFKVFDDEKMAELVDSVKLDELSLWDGKISVALQYMVKILHIVPYRRRVIISL